MDIAVIYRLVEVARQAHMTAIWCGACSRANAIQII